MKDNIKRINLCFNLNNERAKKAYNTIQEYNAKTAFVISAVLAFIENKDEINKEIIKEAVKEALRESGAKIELQKESRSKETGGIPDDVFNLLSGL
ncbi:hypothetical protein SAMN02745135_01991 [Caloranaerobacter azorensis DSM 13643]|uniref:Uncharacterized protein n=1 Tax=Caloranaerobacter azorensis DSM 13643 TaxID=1121264 RepID=A0A1M5VLD4_9FIRM|nr:hypothetical protein [Caloranaerobacter azorensis]SHH75864.1 hypothetical protein SAMN02745135_01991 [Caloranaerobacter azorensis DSM 13643]